MDRGDAGLRVALDLGTILEHCRCSICMGIIKNTRAVAACMHRFCKVCIEAWLRTQIENNCPQCRVKFSSKRDCKPDPVFDLLLNTMFGDIEAFEQQMLDPPQQVLEGAKTVGQKLLQEHALQQYGPSAGPHDGSLLAKECPAHDQQKKHLQRPQALRARCTDAAVTMRPPAVEAQLSPSMLKPGPSAGPVLQLDTSTNPSSGNHLTGVDGSSNLKEHRRADPSVVEETDVVQYRGVRWQGDSWQARTKRFGKELSLGLYDTPEEAGMAYDLDRLQQQGGKAQRLNFPLLRAHYKQILQDFVDMYSADGMIQFLAVAVQAAVKVASNVPGATAPENTGPAAASFLNPRRSTTPAPYSRPLPSCGLPFIMPANSSGTSPTAFVPVQSMRCDAEMPDLPSPQHVTASQQANQLANERSLVLGLAHGSVWLHLAAGSGLSWNMDMLACPVTADIHQVTMAILRGVSQQHEVVAKSLQAALSVINEVDVAANFDAFCYEDSAAGHLFLRHHVTVRDLLHSMHNPAEALRLEYHITVAGTNCVDRAVPPNLQVPTADTHPAAEFADINSCQ